MAVIELENITKRVGPAEVLSHVDLRLEGGKVHSLAGENGAGKSTLVKILGGIHQPDGGRIVRDGMETMIAGAAEAQRQGIAIVHQHPALFPDLTVAENVFVGRQPRRLGRIDWTAMAERTSELLEALRVDIDPEAPVKFLTIAERQSVEIVKALALDARVLVMDEPTSAISGQEVDRLFDLVARLKSQGVAILFISHFIDEILGVGDEVTILRSGKRVLSCPTAELTAAQCVRHMIGSEPSAFFPKQAAKLGSRVLSVRGLSGASFVEDVSFDLRAGEILGFFGLVGAGRSEVAEMLFGIRPPTRGRVDIDGRPVKLGSPRKAMRLGLSFLPEDRHQQGLVLQFPIRANETLPILRRLCGAVGIVNRRREETIATEIAQRMRVVASGIEQLTSMLSGGNQQKVLLAKWLLPSPRVLVLDQPTRGIDVGAKAEIHRTISQLAATGIAIILIGDDAEEVIAMADRILVFRSGRINAEFERDSFDREAILIAAAHTARTEVDAPRAA
jgi:rhamnose transport system ATP-binding protein